MGEGGLAMEELKVNQRERAEIQALWLRLLGCGVDNGNGGDAVR